MTKALLHVNLPNLDEVVFVGSRYLLPATGQMDTLYVVKNDETSSNQPTQYYYNGSEYVMLSGGSGNGGMQDYQQVTKLGVTATASAPRQYDMVINHTTTFLRAPLEVLKFTAGAQNIVTTEVAFDNSDAADFNESEFVIFDGAMKLKTNYTAAMTDDAAWTGTGSLLRQPVNLGNFKKINSMVSS